MRDEDVIAAWDMVVPAEHGTWWLDEAKARRVLRSDTDLSTLVQLGVGFDGARLSGSDIWNIGFYDPSRSSKPALEFDFFRRLLRKRSEWTVPRSFMVTVTADCAEGARCAEGSWDDIPVQGGTLQLSSVQDGRAVWTGRVDVRGTSAEVLAPTVTDLWRESLSRFRFHYLPDSSDHVTAEARRRGVGDCLALSSHLAEELRACGADAEVRVGYLNGGFSMGRHHWVSFMDADGLRKVLDLSMALVADRYVGAEYRDFCRGSLLNRVVELAGNQGAVVAHSCSVGEVQVALDRFALAR